jgi:hypothetical protein
MKKILIPILIAAFVSIGGIMVFSIMNDAQSAIEIQKQNQVQFAEAVMPDTCTMSFDKAKLDAGFSIKVPQTLPELYSLVDVNSHKGIMTILYSDKQLCGKEGVPQTYSDGLLKFIISTPEQSEYEISNGIAYFEEFKKYSDYPGRIVMLEINGNYAMGWESGMKKNITQFDNGTIVNVEEIPYPAQLQIIDPTEQKYYVLKGYFPLEQLKHIAQSIG